MERNQIRERQMEGIRIAKMKGKFLGRQKGSKEDVLKFLSKDKNKKALELLKKGYKIVEVAKINGTTLQHGFKSEEDWTFRRIEYETKKLQRTSIRD